MEQENALTFEKLLDWLEKRLPEEAAQQVAAQVETAGMAVQADVAWLRKFYHASRNIVLPEPPTAVSKSLERQFATYARRRHPPSAWQRFVAALRFDSHATPAVGVRASLTTPDQRQLIFETAVATIVCTLVRSSSEQHFDMWGQILPAPAAEVAVDQVQVQLLQEKEPIDSTQTDDFGEFDIPALPVGSYDLVLNSNRYEIVISPLHITG